MPQTVFDAPLLFAVVVGVVVVAALAVLIWALRTPAALDVPWIVPAVFISIIVLAAALAPFYPLLLLLLVPAALLALALYVLLRGRRAV